MTRINLKEVSLVLAGAAADADAPIGRTEVISVKTADTKDYQELARRISRRLITQPVLGPEDLEEMGAS